MLRERFAELGPSATRFLDGLLAGQRYGKAQGLKVLALLATYTRADWLAALERSVQFGAYSLDAVERILATHAQPKSLLDIEIDHDRQPLPEHLTDNPVLPRPLTDYPYLVEHTTDHASPQQAPNHADTNPTDDADRSA
jgi:hypothetical protein